jgi:hypothetical protein
VSVHEVLRKTAIVVNDLSDTVQNKLRESVSVKDFGAVGDGTTDDTAAIQAACTYIFGLDASRPVLFFPAGIYLITSPITTDEDGVVFEGSGNAAPFDSLSSYAGGTTIKYGGTAIPEASGGVFTIGGSSQQCRGLTIRNLTIDCQDLANAVWGEQTNSLFVENVTTLQAIWGIYKIGDNNNSDIFRNCVFYDPPTGGGGISLRENCHSATIQDCQFGNKTTGTRNPAYGILVAKDGNCSDFMVIGCNFDYHRVTTSHFYLDNDCRGFSFIGNYIEGRDDGVTAATCILSGGSGAVIHGNRITAPAALGIDYGINCYSTCESVSIIGNYFDGFDVAAIRIASGARNINCMSNEINSCPTLFINQNAAGSKNSLTVADGDVVTDSVTTNKLVCSNISTLTIASGAVTVTSTYHRLDTEGGAATDNLDTINGGVDGQLLILSDVSSSRDVTAKDATGNIQLTGDFTFLTARDKLILIYDATAGVWCEISRSTN